MLKANTTQLESLLNEIIHAVNNLKLYKIVTQFKKKPELFNKLFDFLLGFNSVLDSIEKDGAPYNFYLEQQAKIVNLNKDLNEVKNTLTQIISTMQSSDGFIIQTLQEKIKAITQMQDRIEAIGQESQKIKEKEEQDERQYEKMVKQLEDIQASIDLQEAKTATIRAYRSNIATHTYEYQKTLATAAQKPIRYTYDVPTILLLLQMFLIHLRSAL